MATKRHLLSLFILTGLLHGCASKPVAKCASLDWFEIGRRDGSSGLAYSTFEKHLDQCNGNPGQDAKTRYQNGRSNGLVSFCSTKNGWDFGRSGNSYSNVCPKAFEGSFRKGYEPGIKAFQIEREIDKLNYQLRVDRLDFLQRHRLNQRVSHLESQLELIRQPDSADFSLQKASTN